MNNPLPCYQRYRCYRPFCSLSSNPRRIGNVSIEQHPLSRKLQANKDHFARAIGHFILVKVNPEAAWQMPEESA